MLTKAKATCYNQSTGRVQNSAIFQLHVNPQPNPIQFSISYLGHDPSAKGIPKLDLNSNAKCCAEPQACVELGSNKSLHEILRVVLLFFFF